MHTKILALLFAITLFLTGCVNVATTGAQAVYNHHSLQKTIGDQYITSQAYNDLYQRSIQFKETSISVSTLNGEVLLSGQVSTEWQKSKAEKIVRAIPGVDEVYNSISVEGQASALVEVSDTWITTKIKAKLIASGDVDATQIKVVTENGTVYLMGTVLPEEAKAATELASDTDGVQKVVRLFSYIRITKHLYL